MRHKCRYVLGVTTLQRIRKEFTRVYMQTNTCRTCRKFVSLMWRPLDANVLVFFDSSINTAHAQLLDKAVKQTHIYTWERFKKCNDVIELLKETL